MEISGGEVGGAEGLALGLGTSWGVNNGTGTWTVVGRSGASVGGVDTDGVEQAASNSAAMAAPIPRAFPIMS
ncbi:hypothetical protein M1O29_01170 [Dehalococcoidia bacterium]|nr:hypothetical protein [Dehalococcoidia bacterium]